MIGQNEMGIKKWEFVERGHKVVGIKKEVPKKKELKMSDHKELIIKNENSYNVWIKMRRMGCRNEVKKKRFNLIIYLIIWNLNRRGSSFI